MSNKKNKDKKIKARKNRIKEKALMKKQEKIKKNKMEEISASIEKEYSVKNVPYRKELDANYQVKLDNKKLEKNIKILKALEEEYKREQESRENLNEELKAEGFDSLEEKMNAIHAKAVENLGKIQTETSIAKRNMKKIGGSAKVHVEYND